MLDREPRLRDSDVRLSSTLTVAPTIAEMDRAAAMLPTGGVIERPALLVNVPTIADPTMAPPGRHVLSLEVLLTPYALPGGWPGSPEPRALARPVRRARANPGLLESIVDWRAMTPDVYEREFHLPDGHAASFGGGPLAALRSTAARADRLRDGGARASSSPARRRSPAPASGAPAAATAPPSCSPALA